MSRDIPALRFNIKTDEDLKPEAIEFATWVKVLDQACSTLNRCLISPLTVLGTFDFKQVLLLPIDNYFVAYNIVDHEIIIRQVVIKPSEF